MRQGETSPVCGIGPLSPPITGPGIKNRDLKSGLENAGVTVDWVNTLEFGADTVKEIVSASTEYDYYILSASTKVRLAVGLVLFPRLRTSSAQGVLLPMGGQFAEELESFPPGLRQMAVRMFGSFDGIFPETDSLSTPIRRTTDHRTLVETLPNLRERPREYELEACTTSDGPLRIVYVGRIKETKGLDDLLAAYSLARSNGADVKLDIYGHFLEDDPYEDSFRETCAKTTGAEYKGKIPDGGVIETLKEYDVFVFPSYYPGEGFPGVFIEAFMAGCPIIATDWNFNSELIETGTNGYLFEPRDHEKLAEKLQYVSSHDSELRAMQQNAFEISEQYSAEAVTDELLDYLDSFGWDVVPDERE
ncbi:glycosyltransferase family 4 protein [Halosimplex sp. J119]